MVKGTSLDKKKLMYELSKRNLSLEGVSKELGMNPQYLSNAIYKANKSVTQEVRVSPLCVRLLYELYNIRPESILFEFEKPQAKDDAKDATNNICNGVNITPEALYSIIYRAVYEAMTLALKGE